MRFGALRLDSRQEILPVDIVLLQYLGQGDGFLGRLGNILILGFDQR